MLTIKTFVFNPFAENTYVVSDGTGECIILDAGCYSAAECHALEEYILAKGLKPVLAVCTHGHVDHMLGVQFVKERFGIPFAVHPADNFLIESSPVHGQIYGFKVESVPTIDVELAHEGMVSFGQTSLKVIHTPGHTPGHVCLYEEAGKTLFTGDTLFRESIGRTDLPGGDYSWIMRSILDRILPLGGDVEFHPGHGPASSIGHEALYNPFIVEVVGGETSF